MENKFFVVGRIAYSESADVLRVISSGTPLLDASAEIDVYGDILLCCSDQDLNIEIVLGYIYLAPAEMAIFLNYMVVHEKTEIPCVLNCIDGSVILDYYYELAN